MKVHLWSLMCLLLPVLMAGCGGGGGSASPSTLGQTGTAAFTVTWPTRARLIPKAAQSITIQVDNTTQVMHLPASGNISTLNFTGLTIGAHPYQATAYATIDCTGTPVGAAAGAVSISAPMTSTTVDLTTVMASTIDHITLAAVPGPTPGDTLPLTATAYDSNNHVVLVPASNAFAWSSSDRGIATVDATGLVTGIAGGSATITATETESGKSGTLPVTVSPLAIQDLGPGYASDINDAGQVVGSSENTNNGCYQAVLWTQGSMQNLGTLTDTVNSEAIGINDSGQVVGISDVNDSNQHAFLWTQGSMQDLVNLSGGTSCEANGINAAGQVVGDSWVDGVDHALLWTQGSIQDLGSLPSMSGSLAHGINAAGQVVGWATSNSGNNHAVLWIQGHIQDLGTLPGGTLSYAQGINTAGQVVGYSDDNTGDMHAFLWTQGSMQDLGTLPGGTDSWAFGINDAGQVVGESDDNNRIGHAVLWTQGHIQDLGMLPGKASTYALGINNAGQVVGYSGDNNGIGHAVLWTLPTTSSRASNGHALFVTAGSNAPATGAASRVAVPCITLMAKEVAHRWAR